MRNILIFGDSIVAGRGISKSQSWVSLLAQLMDNKDKKNTLVYNLGVPGESTKELLKRFKIECQSRTQKRSPEDMSIIVISIGINDSKGIGYPKHHKTPPKIFHQNIHNLIKISTQHTSRMIFIGLTPVNEDKTTSLENNYFLNSSIKKYNNIIKKICGKTKITFVEIFEDWIKKDYKKFLSDDGIHLNEIGHKKIFEKVVQLLISSPTIQFNPFQILKKEYSLSNVDIKIIKSRFIKSTTYNSPFVIGQFFENTSEVVIGGPCIRKDIEGITLSVFYQIFMPLKIASILHIPCKIFLGIQEEIIFQPKLSNAYKKLGSQLTKAIKKISDELQVNVEVIDTLSYKYDTLINCCIRELNIQLSPENSTYLFNLSQKKLPKPLHSSLRIFSNKRVIICYTSYTLKKLFGKHNYLIVEDVEQYVCALFAQKFEKNKSPNFLAILSLPNIYGTASMFKSEKEERFLLGQNKNYYKLIFEKIPEEIFKVYKELFNLVMGDSYEFDKGSDNCLKIVKKISNYFVV